MPTSGSKMKVKYIEPQYVDGKLIIRSRYDDISICGKIVALMRTMNEAIEMNRGTMGDVDLEHALAQFVLTFRSTILGDPKLVMLG